MVNVKVPPYLFFHGTTEQLTHLSLIWYDGHYNMAHGYRKTIHIPQKKTSLSTDKHSALTFPGNQQILNGGVRGTRALHTQLE